MCHKISSPKLSLTSRTELLALTRWIDVSAGRWSWLTSGKAGLWKVTIAEVPKNAAEEKGQFVRRGKRQSHISGNWAEKLGKDERICGRRGGKAMLSILDGFPQATAATPVPEQAPASPIGLSTISHNARKKTNLANESD
jgi:hypothetical protein